jgi:hypothetical protein
VDFHRTNFDSVLKSMRSNAQIGFELGNSGVVAGMWRIAHGRLGLRLILGMEDLYDGTCRASVWCRGLLIFTGPARGRDDQQRHENGNVGYSKLRELFSKCLNHERKVMILNGGCDNPEANRDF